MDQTLTVSIFERMTPKEKQINKNKSQIEKNGSNENQKLRTNKNMCAEYHFLNEMYDVQA